MKISMIMKVITIPDLKKHIPINSLNFIFKFDSLEALRDCISNKTFESAQARLFNIATVAGAELKMFTNPKELE